MAIAEPRPPQIEAPTQETGTLPRIPERERRRALLTMPRLAPGRYLAIEDGDEVVLLPLTAELMHIGRSPAADIVLDDASVSRRHALIARRGERTRDPRRPQPQRRARQRRSGSARRRSATATRSSAGT